VKTQPAAKIAARDRCLDQRRAELGALLARVEPDAAGGAPVGRVEPGAAGVAPPLARDATGPAAPRGLDRVVDALSVLPSPAECAIVEVGTADPLPLEASLANLAREVEQGLPAIRAANALGDSRPVLASATALVEVARKSTHAPTLAEALLVHAETLRGASQLADAQLAARDAVAAAERGHDDATAARAWIARVATAGDRRELTQAEDFGAIAAAAIDRAGASPRLAATLLRLRGLVAYNRGLFTEAATLLTEARARFVATSGARSLDVATVESALGSVARAAGDLDAAERWHRGALAIDRELRGNMHPDIARDLHNLAGVQRLRGALADAERTYREALVIEETTRGARSVEAALTHNSLGLVAMANARWPEARIELVIARDLLVAADHGDRAFAHHNLGLVEAATGDHLLALTHFTRAAEVYAHTIGEHTPPAIRLLLDRARSEVMLGESVGFEHAQRAIAEAKQAGIGWIQADGALLLSEGLFRAGRTKPARDPRTPVEVRVEPPIRGTTATQPAAAEVAPTPDPPKPEPKRDVGVYGSTQTW
jgi:tetratricopeptide (TPR) repeat protein